MFFRKALIVFVMLFVLAGVISPAIPAENTSQEKELRQIEREMISDGNFEKAREKLTVMLKDSPEDSRVYTDLGIAYYGLMDYDAAYNNFKKAEEKIPPSEFREMVSYAISNIDENREALDGIGEVAVFLEMDPGSAEGLVKDKLAAGHLTMLNALTTEKYYYPAMVTPHLVWLKENMPELDGLYALSADIYYSAMFYRKASEDYKKAIEEDPENIRLNNSLADCLVAVGDFDGAQEYYDKTIELYLKEGRGKKDPEVRRLQKIKRTLPRTYKDISELIEKKRFFEAGEICKKRMSLNPGDYAAITQLGEIYWETQKRKEAIRLFRKVVKMAPDYPVAHFFLGKAYIFERKPEKGIKEFEIFMEKMESLPEMDEKTVDFYSSALQYMSYMYSLRDREKDTLRTLKRAIELKPDDQRAHYNLAVTYYTHYNNRPRAYAELQKVIEIEPVGRIADMARFYIDYMRRNPDSRVIGNFTFLEED